jgi:NADH dehydrogenase [ubiquinone] 1 alpha subcomplex assembly factor 7
VTPLERTIRERIRRDGPLPVSHYMAIALADPDHGYYRKADPLGARGDFITAPEISQVFGEIIGLWCAVTWQRAGCPAPVNLVELGPGRGSLMADALRAALAVPDFIAAAHVHLVETSPALRACQRAALADYSPDWHESVHTVPTGPALIIANEFFDALPVDQYVRTGNGWRGRRVGIDEATDRLAFVVVDDRAAPEGIVPQEAADAPPGSLFEHCPTGCAIAGEIGRRLAGHGIAALIIDYGHTRRGAGETLQAVRAHRRHDVLSDPGEADLTAHVDFATLAEAAVCTGAVSWGPVPQGAFLAGLGVEARTERLAAGVDPDRAALLRSGCRRLIAADGMGALFKVLALTQAVSDSPAGFEAAAPSPPRSGAHW